MADAYRAGIELDASWHALVATPALAPPKSSKSRFILPYTSIRWVSCHADGGW